ncbi:MAG: hypothetical protein JXA99_06170 [Candidatus Lokiarchaeota archaeon]|nr:hypothetical protein [Candidatus Lokiarchaeota archaeon]
MKKISSFISKKKERYLLNGISIRGRNEMCLNKTLISLKPNSSESMSICKDLRNNHNCSHFLNLLKKKDSIDNPILLSPELFNKPIDADDLINLCKEKKICPYFLSKFLLPEMKIIICNYQWILNPYIRKSFLKFIGKELHECIIVVDECHNIVDLATEINSLKISPYSLRLCLRDLELYRAPSIMHNFAKILLNHLLKKKKKLNDIELSISPEKLLNNIYLALGHTDLNEFKNFINDLYDFSVAIHEEKTANGLISRDYIGILAEFWLIWIKTVSSDKYFFCYSIIERNEKKSINLEIVALDPREITLPLLKYSYSILHLSGTINPYVYHNLIGLNQSGKSYKGIIAESPFKRENVKALIIDGVDTRKKNRNPSMFKKIIQKINEVLYCTPANIGIFCASYGILKALINNGIEQIVLNNNKKLFVENSGLTAQENSLLIEDFKSLADPPNNGAVLLGVSGGRNSEGEDYPGNYMNAVIITGFPYHLPTPRIEAKIHYYDKVFHNQGWDFAYLYPAVQRANQASGRPIRKLDDKGAIIFMDCRFIQKVKWISNWIKNRLEVIPDKPDVIKQKLYPFWNIDK